MTTEPDGGPDDFGDDFDDDDCPWCGGDGSAMYLDCPEVWGEDCPGEEDHLITCPACKGTGRASECDVL